MKERILQNLVDKLENGGIKETYQFYAIFEEERKALAQELKEYEESKEEMIKINNEISAKNALLQVENRELLEKNFNLQETLNSMETRLHKIQELEANAQERLEQIQQSFKDIEMTHNTVSQEQSGQLDYAMSNSVNEDMEIPKVAPLQKVEVLYREQRMLAFPAKKYVNFDVANTLLTLLKNQQEQCLNLELELAKVRVEYRDLQNEQVQSSKLIEEFLYRINLLKQANSGEMLEEDFVVPDFMAIENKKEASSQQGENLEDMGEDIELDADDIVIEEESLEPPAKKSLNE